MTKENEKNWFWIVKNTIFIIIYGIVATLGYSTVAEIHIQEPRTLFTPLDHAIPFVSAFVIPYVFIFYPFLMFTMGYFAYISSRKFNQFFAATMLVYVISFTTYIVFPVMMIRPSPSEMPTDFLSLVMQKYYASDPPLNCFPSLHAASSTLVAYFLSREKPKYKWVFWSIAFLIILSTLFVRQHVIVDEIAGFAVAYFASWFAEQKIKEENITDAYMNVRIAVTLVAATIISAGLILPYLP